MYVYILFGRIHFNRLKMVVKSIKNRHSWNLPRIAQESIKILSSTVVLNSVDCTMEENERKTEAEWENMRMMTKKKKKTNK